MWICWFNRCLLGLFSDGQIDDEKVLIGVGVSYLGLQGVMVGSKVRVKVSSVTGIRDPEGREGYRIEFVEVREKPPMVMMTPTEVPKEISRMVVQISRGIQKSLPGGRTRQYELPKLTLTFTAEELEAFELKPYPNSIYELTISKGNLSFKKI